MCLTEKQKKLRDVHFSDSCMIVDSMREEKDRKGGGLIVIYRMDMSRAGEGTNKMP